MFHHMTGEVVRLQLAAYMFTMDRLRPAGWVERRMKVQAVFNSLGNVASYFDIYSSTFYR